MWASARKNLESLTQKDCLVPDLAVTFSWVFFVYQYAQGLGVTCWSCVHISGKSLQRHTSRYLKVTNKLREKACNKTVMYRTNKCGDGNKSWTPCLINRAVWLKQTTHPYRSQWKAREMPGYVSELAIVCLVVGRLKNNIFLSGGFGWVVGGSICTACKLHGCISNIQQNSMILDSCSNSKIEASLINYFSTHLTNPHSMPLKHQILGLTVDSALCCL